MEEREQFELIRSLRERAARDASGLHYVEGIRPVLEAIDAGIPIEHLVYNDVLLRNSYAQKKVRLCKRAGFRVARVTPEEFRSISWTARASGIGAIARQHWMPLESANLHRGLCWIALSRMRSPGNLGTIVRTAEAVGVGGVILLGDSIDVFDPAVIRASLEGIFRLGLVRTTLQRFEAWSKSRACRVVATTPSASLSYTNGPVRSPMIVLFGEERSGLTAQELAVCTHRVSIPIVGRADSLNVGVAAGVMLYEILRRKGI